LLVQEVGLTQLPPEMWIVDTRGQWHVVRNMHWGN